MRTPADVMDMRSIQLDPAMRPLQEKIFRQIKLEMDLQMASPEFEEEFLYHLMFMVNRLRFHVRLKSPMAAEGFFWRSTPPMTGPSGRPSSAVRAG